jgi:hypothetical protein
MSTNFNTGSEACREKVDEAQRAAWKVCHDENEKTAKECVYIKDNKATDDDATWTKEFGENWHACLLLCKDKAKDMVLCY